MNDPAETLVGPSKEEVQELMGLLRSGKLDDAIAFGEGLARQNPGSIQLYQILGALNFELKRHDQAAIWFERVLQINPDVPDALFNLGVTRQQLNRNREAISCFRRLIGLKPDFAETHFNLGLLLLREGQTAEGIATLRTTVRIKPDHADAHANLGLALQLQGQLDEASDSFREALRVQPDHAAALGHLLHLQAQTCDWDALRASARRVPDLGVLGDAVSPFGLLSLEDEPVRHRIRSEKYGRICAPHAAPPSLAYKRERPKRLGIGYFSADVRDHATMYLMARLFELHDRSRFSIHLFSYGAERDDAARRRAVAAVDQFHDVRALENAAVAELARHQEIDIAIDLKGYTHNNRIGIFAHRPAPIQMTYIGYPGTLGLPFIDYLIADATVIPNDQRQHYSENIIYLPDSYQVNDDNREIADHPSSRAEAGLPSRSFVFCCFNNSFKIGVDEFDIWMRLLRSVEGSVLWLFKSNAVAETNLRREAERRGISADRLIFAPHIPQAQHLARLRHADLVLDTFNVNAHTTASDALWAGVLVLTMAGKGFAARVAASLLRAVGLPELIVETQEDYERLALALANDPARFAALRGRLSKRATTPLFDTARTVRKIEAAFDEAFDRWIRGTGATDFTIE